MATAWADGTTAPAGMAGGLMQMILPLVIIGLIFYLLVFLPENKRQKEHKALLESLKKGDRALTSGGLYGVVVGVNEKDGVVVLKIAENVKVEVTRSSITSVKPSSGGGPIS